MSKYNKLLIGCDSMDSVLSSAAASAINMSVCAIAGKQIVELSIGPNKTKSPPTIT